MFGDMSASIKLQSMSVGDCLKIFVTFKGAVFVSCQQVNEYQTMRRYKRLSELGQIKVHKKSTCTFLYLHISGNIDRKWWAEATTEHFQA